MSIWFLFRFRSCGRVETLVWFGWRWLGAALSGLLIHVSGQGNCHVRGVQLELRFSAPHKETNSGDGARLIISGVLHVKLKIYFRFLVLSFC